eukprot:3121894-Rhodomonas_salina.2
MLVANRNRIWLQGLAVTEGQVVPAQHWVGTACCWRGRREQGAAPRTPQSMPSRDRPPARPTLRSTTRPPEFYTFVSR